MAIGPFHGLYVTPSIMASMPALVSAGICVVHYKYSFICLPGKTPCFISDKSNIIVLKVRGDIPYVDEDALWWTERLALEHICEMTGDHFDAPLGGHVLEIDHPLRPRQPQVWPTLRKWGRAVQGQRWEEVFPELEFRCKSIGIDDVEASVPLPKFT